MNSREAQSETVRMLVESTAAIVPRTGDLTRIRRLRFTHAGFDRAVWRKMCDLGWPGLRVAEAAGGAGLGASALIALMIELGRGLVPEPMIQCGMTAALLDGEHLADVLSGSIIVPAWQEEANTLAAGRMEIGADGITGTRRFIPCARGADAFLVLGEANAALVRADAPGVRLTVDDTQDGGHFGTLTLTKTPAERIPLPPETISDALDQATLAVAAYLVGLSERAFEMTIDYLKTRHQFGRPIGSFQALQHRAVDLKIQLALARASVEGVAASMDDGAPPGVRAAAVSRAKARASHVALLITRQAVQMHGAIGYTDEYDLGLFLRKAMVVAPLFGSAAMHEKRFTHYLVQQLHGSEPGLVDKAADARREGGVDNATRDKVTPDRLRNVDADEFRQVIRHWIEENYPPEIRHPAKRLHLRDTRVWYDVLAKQGWLAPGWPQEFGGLGLPAAKQLIIIEEQERFGCARTNDMGIVFLGPLLIKYGLAEQKAFFLPRILSGEHIWCQGYSEPNSGSDLASLQTEAVLDGDEWVINGQKIWTTLANDANWIFLLVRTNKNARKQEGISFLLVPMDSPGITVRPIVSLDLNDEFCQVFFDDVRVPRKNIVGEADQGWTMAKAQLGFERIFLGSPKQSAYAISQLKELGRRLGLLENADFQGALTRLQFDFEDHTALYESCADRLRKGEELGSETSLLKVHQSELFQRISEAMLTFAGEYGGQLHRHADLGHANPAGLFIQSRLVTIAAGSSEIQRNIVARHVLGLPT